MIAVIGSDLKHKVELGHRVRKDQEDLPVLPALKELKV